MKKNKFLTRFLTAILAGGILVGTVVLSPFITASAMSVPTQGYSNVIWGGNSEDEWYDIVFSYDDYIVGSGTSLKTVNFPIHIGLAYDGSEDIRLTDYFFTPYSYWAEPDDEGYYSGGWELTPDEPIFDYSTYEKIEVAYDGNNGYSYGIVYPIWGNQNYMLSGFISSCYLYRNDDFNETAITLTPWEVLSYFVLNNMTIDNGFTFVGTYNKNLSEYFGELNDNQYTYYRFYSLHFSGLYGYLTFFVPYGNSIIDTSVLTTSNISIAPVRSYSDGYNTGYSAGRTAGYNDGYATGYTLGDIEGYFRGYDEGKTDGIEEGGGGTIVVDEIDYTSSLVENINNLLSIEIFPNVSFRTILLWSFGLIVAFGVIKYIF